MLIDVLKLLICGAAAAAGEAGRSRPAGEETGR